LQHFLPSYLRLTGVAITPGRSLEEPLLLTIAPADLFSAPTVDSSLEDIDRPIAPYHSPIVLPEMETLEQFSKDLPSGQPDGSSHSDDNWVAWAVVLQIFISFVFI